MFLIILCCVFLSLCFLHFHEALVSMFRTKLLHKEMPEKSNSTVGRSELTNGTEKGIFCFQTAKYPGYFI